MNYRYRLAMPAFLIIILFVLLPFSSRPAFPAQDIVGVWTDAAGEVVYGFMANHEFLFRPSKRSKKDGNGSWNQEAQGTWQMAQSICWKGSRDNAQQSGNLMIYVRSLHCCLVANRLDGGLVLTKVWEGGYTSFRGVCQDRMLRHRKETMK